MTIDGKSFLIGVLLGAAAVVGAAYIPVHSMQVELASSKQELSKATVELSQVTADRNQQIEVSQTLFRRVNELTAQRVTGIPAQQFASGPNPQLEAVVVAMYNRIHPGLGDAIKMLIDQHAPRGN